MVFWWRKGKGYNMLKYNLKNHLFGINKDINWDTIRQNNLKWWSTVGIHDPKEKPETKKKNYDVFLDDLISTTNIDIFNSHDKKIGEICCGPYGGILECYGVECNQKYFIDIFMEDFKQMNFVQWSKNSNFVSAPSEHIHLSDNTLDILLGYNSIDHGWDWEKSLDECLRISKSIFLMFDTKNEVDGDLHPQKISHEDVLKYAEKNNWHAKFKHVTIKKRYKDYGYYENCFEWPETWIYIIK